MKRIPYITFVDSDVKFDPELFSNDVDIYLADPNGWESKGYVFVRVQKASPTTVRIYLSSPETIKKFGCESNLSCAQMGGTELRVNAMRWSRGAPDSKLDLDSYRQYVVSHEMGHILGHDHVKCPGAGQSAPIMMQQTLGIGECSPNTKVYGYKTM